MTVFTSIEGLIGTQLLGLEEVFGESPDTVSFLAPTVRIIGTITQGDTDPYLIDISAITRLAPATSIVFDVDYASVPGTSSDLVLDVDLGASTRSFDDAPADPGSAAVGGTNADSALTRDPGGTVTFGELLAASTTFIGFTLRGFRATDVASYTLNVTFLNDNLKFGGDFADFLVTSGVDGVIFGFDGNDILVIDGADGGSLWGGQGNDRLLGHDGNDTAAGDEGNDRVDGLGGNDSLQGNAGFDRLSGGAGADTLDGGADADNLAGGEGNDLILDTALSTSARLDTLAGGEGDDTLVGGFDMMVGGEGNDLLRIATLANEGTIVPGARLSGGDGTDRVEIVGAFRPEGSIALTTFGRALTLTSTGATSWTLSESGGVIATIRDVESIFMAGSSAGDTLEGGAGADSLLSGDGSDFLDGGAGNDTLFGANFLLFVGPGIGTRDRMMGGAGNDSILAVDASDAFGESGNDTILATGTASRLDGGSGNDFLDGNVAGVEYLGGSGADTISIARPSAGGAFPVADGIEGGSGNDLLILDLTGESFVTSRVVGANARALFTANGAGVTLIEGIERAQVSGTGLSFLDFKGFSGGDTLDGSGTTGADLNGDAGNDSLIGSDANDVLTGGIGNDTMNGKGGNDFYEINNNRDTIIELAGGGADTVSTAMSGYTLPDEIEGLSLTTAGLGAGNVVRGTGNSGANRMEVVAGPAATSAAGFLIGGGGADTLFGAATNDTLQGGAGADVLSGSAGNDAFRFTSTTDRTDTISDFTAGQDQLEFLSRAFSMAAGTDMTAPGRFSSNTTGVATGTLAQFVFETDTGMLWFDSDGTGSAGRLAMATLTGVTSLSASSIVIIA